MKTAITLIRTTVLFLLLSTSLPYFVMAQHTLNIQYTYIDALNLADTSNQKKKEFIKKTLEKYGDSLVLIENDFLKDLLFAPDNNDSSKTRGTDSRTKGNQNRDSESSKLTDQLSEKAPNTTQYISWEAAVINGMANFITKRMKDEITAMAIEKIFQTKTEALKYVTILLPKTCKLIEYNKKDKDKDKLYTTMDLECIRQAAIIDIIDLPKTMSESVDNLFPNAESEEKLLIQAGLQIYSDVIAGAPPDVIIKNLSESTKLKANGDSIKIFQLLHFVSCALKAPSGKEQVWVSPSDLSIIDIENKKKPEVKIFYGLLIQQILQSDDYKSILGLSNGADYQTVKYRVHQLIQTAFHLNNALDGLTTEGKKLRNIDDLIFYADRINQIIQYFIKTVNELKPKPNSTIANEFLPKLTSYLSITTAALKQDYKTAFPLLIAEFSDILDIPQDDKNLIFLAGQISSVRSSEEFEAVLESYVLPIGASRLKRHSKINLSINCYGGVTGLYEYYNDDSGWNIGLAAPIGVAFTFRLWNSDFNNCLDGTFSLFLSLLDLGTVVNQRFDGNNASFPQLKLEHFFAPGLGLYYNITDMPISFGFHFNYIPNLRTIEFENSNAIITETKKSVIRLNFSVLVDIPLFTLYNR